MRNEDETREPLARVLARTFLEKLAEEFAEMVVDWVRDRIPGPDREETPENKEPHQ